MLVWQIFPIELVSTIYKDSQFFKMRLKFGQAQHHRSWRDFFLQGFLNALTPLDYLKFYWESTLHIIIKVLFCLSR